MIDLRQLGFSQVWGLDFEFTSRPGNRPMPVCMVARERFSGRITRLSQDELQRSVRPPFSVASDSLLMAYFASAEMGCFLQLGWSFPQNLIDLFAEFRNLTNGLTAPAGNSLLGALSYFGLNVMGAVEKEEMRALAIRGGPFTTAEQAALLDYCQGDVMALHQLSNCMLPKINVPQALLRGRYACAVARMERVGIPIDVPAWEMLKTNWENIQDRLIDHVDGDGHYKVFEGRVFGVTRMEKYVLRNRIKWPHLESGKLALDDKTFKVMARAHPQIEPLRQLRQSLSQMRLADFSIGDDGRNRALLSPFASRTGRNQPSNSKFIPGAASWFRGLIKPPAGFVLAYLDYEQEEFGIAAKLSGDAAMQEAYCSGDPYLTSGKQAGKIPPHGTRETHGFVRDQFKTLTLAAMYGMGAESLARLLGQPVSDGQELLRLHRQTYKKYWSWSNACVDHATLHGFLPTVFGWTIHLDPQGKLDSHLVRCLRNFPVQSNGAEVLRLACCLATERGIAVCCPVHDALLVEARLESRDDVVEETRAAMVQASTIVLSGFPLRVEAKLIRHPGRFEDPRGAKMWSTVWGCMATMPSVAVSNVAMAPKVTVPETSTATVMT